MNDLPSFHLSADTRFLIQHLRKAHVGDLITYEALSREVGKSVTGGFPALTSARRVLLREDARVFDTVWGKGLKRLNDSEIVGTSHRTAKKIKRTAQRGVRTLTAISDFSGLPRDQQMRHTAAVSVFGVIAEMTAERGMQKVEKFTDGRREALPIAQTLEAFRS